MSRADLHRKRQANRDFVLRNQPDRAQRPKHRPGPKRRDTIAALNGKVVDLQGEAIAGAILIVRGRSEEASSSQDGTSSLGANWKHRSGSDEAGVYERRINKLQVQEQNDPLEVMMSPQGFQMSDFVISAPRVQGTSATMLAERKDASSVNDVLGAEQMSRAGDSNAAAALKRVTGLTVVGGKYVYVRGLGERYSASLLNGSTLPAPSPSVEWFRSISFQPLSSRASPSKNLQRIDPVNLAAGWSS